MIAIAHGHILNEGNKRTVLFVAMTFLGLNGVMIVDEDNSLLELAVQAATGDLDVLQVANELRQKKV
ncbi:type II toxin-antitoxin system death-on-curing family toxin [Serratia sp. CMO1]|nr:type II toxin-antitoxin system death-on-curing family toxin [Serratia sp. CMO1]QPI30822.1 type II toxin-antitoxin system death-on-curing family toxin [Serratia sp. CMO1]HEJ6940872.1 type II toxin-antitoxin system death-on-curing family toxin [Serratia marcescens]